MSATDHTLTDAERAMFERIEDTGDTQGLTWRVQELVAEARAWEGAKGLEWTVPSPAPHHTFTTPPVIGPGDLAHGDITH